MSIGRKKIQNGNQPAFGSVGLSPFRTRVVTVALSNHTELKVDHALLYIRGSAIQGSSESTCHAMAPLEHHLRIV